MNDWFAWAYGLAGGIPLGIFIDRVLIRPTVILFARAARRRHGR